MTNKTLFIEKNAGMMFQVKLTESILQEVNESGMMILRNVPCTVLDETNANGRMYEESVMQQALKENTDKGLYEARSLKCTANDHPATTYPVPTDASHVVIGTKIVKEGGKSILLNDWLILDTTQGKNLQALIKGGTSNGTSIRGLGRKNEATGSIEDYEFLGTDVVGNPSAGTFANFKSLNESIEVEAPNAILVESVKKSMNDTNNNKSTVKEDTNKMFNLEDAISAFKSKHQEGEISSEAISDLLKIEMQVIENESDTEAFEEFKESILGAIPKKESKEDNDKNLKAEEAKNEDVINKAQRHLEASEIVASQLKEQNEQLLEEVEALRRYKESSGKIIGELTNRVKTALEDVKQREASIEESEKVLVGKVESAAIQMAKDLQAEAKEAILNLETRLEHTIQMSDIVTKYFYASRSINESLVTRIKKQHEQNKVEEEVSSLSESVVSKQKSKKEPTRPGWK